MIAGQIEIQLLANIARLQRDMDQANRVIGSATSDMARAANTVRAALGGIAAGLGGRELIQMVDQYAKFTAQLKLASQSQREYAAAYSDVKRIATSAQQDLGATGVLYARIANGTRELGTTQKQVAAITETVNMALKVSGASANESASAQLQLSQAFASGTLRGEEFNAVNEAAPRLMKALADGMGLPVGALKAMAGEGQITSKIMADVLPAALEKLREESKEIQTIAGAFTVLRNEVMEFVGVQANASGAVSGLVSLISLLSSNLGLLAGVITTLGVSKLVTMFSSWGAATYKQIADNNALRASTLAGAVTSTEAAATIAAAKLSEAQANVRAAATAANLANARVAELRSAVLAAEGAVALAVATNGLIPAQARAIALSEAHSIALAQQALAGSAATVSAGAASAALTAQAAATGVAARAMGVLRGAMMFLGGPIGAIVTLLGLGATAWMVWGNKAEEANDKAAESFDEAQVRIIKGLDEQIEKNQKLLQFKNLGASTSEAEKALPFVNQLASASERLNQINGRSGEFAGKSNTDVDLARIKVMRDIVDLTEKMAAAEKSGAAVAAKSVAERVAAFKKEHATKTEQRDAELAAIADLKGKTGEYAEMERRIREKYADKGAATAIKQEATAYQALITSIREKIGANALELQGYDKLSESQKATIKLDAAIGTGKNKLSAESIRKARAEIEQLDAQEQAIDAQQRAAKWAEVEAKNDADHYASLRAGTAAIDDRIAQMQREVDLQGLTASAAVDAERAKLQAKLAAGPATYAELAALDAQIAKLNTLADLTRNKEGMDAAVKAGQELDKFLDPTKAQTFGEALRGAFGAAGDSMTQLVSALDVYSIRQAEVDEARKDAATKYAVNSKEFAAASAAISKKELKDRVSSYGDMAGAAKGFFKEGSKGYKTLQTAEQAFRAYELAMAAETLVKKLFFKETEVAANVGLNATKLAGEATASAASTGLAATEASAWGITAVVKAIASLPFPMNLAAGAATLAAVVALGAKVMGGGGGSVSLSESRQKTQGTGTVLGSDAKSESIGRSLELLEAAAGLELNYTQAMAASLKSIEANIGRFSSLLVRTTGVTGAFGEQFTAKGGNIFGGTKTVEDTGFGVNATSLEALMNGGGINAYQYAEIKKKGGWFSSDKMSTQTQGLNADGNRQIADVVKALAGGIKEAAQLLGVGGDDFTARLNGFVVNIGKISLKGLSGDEIQEEIQAAFSKVGDEMASWALGGFEEFQQIGEGYMETLIRVATNYSSLDSIMASMGKTFGATGLQSIGARENLIGLMGGIDKLAEVTQSYADNFLTEAERLAPVQKYVTEQMAAMGYAAVDTRAEFAALVASLNLADGEQASRFAALMNLQEAFAKVYAAGEDLSKSQQEIADEARDLQEQYDQLTMTSTQLLAKQRNALDESNRALFDQIQAVEAQTAAVQAAKDTGANLLAGVDSAFSALQNVVGREKALLQEVTGKHQALATALRGTLDGMRITGQESEDRFDARAQIQAALAIAKASGVLPTADSLKGALSVLGKDSAGLFSTQQEYLRDFYSTQGDLAALAAMTDDALSVDEKSLKALDEILASAQQQVKVLKGIDMSVFSVAEAVSGLARALGAAQADPVASAGGGIAGLYKQLLGRPADSAGLDYWKDQVARGMSLDQARALMQQSDEYKRSVKVPGFAAGGGHEGGWRVVGEQGWELENTGPSRVVSNGDSRRMLDNRQVVEAIDRLQAAVFPVLYQVAKNGGRAANSLENMDRVGVEIREENA